MAEIDASIAGGFCGVCIYSAFARWCITHPFGTDVRCCGGPRGCCGSCCDSSFNKDDFDERVNKAQAEYAPPAKLVDSQPVPSHGMSTVTNNPELVG